VPVNTSFDRYDDVYLDELERAIDGVGDPALFTEIKAKVLLRLAQRFLGPPAGLSALDVGCGPGLTDAFLADELGSLSGVDVSPRMVERAREANPTVSYSVYNGTRLPYDAASFDLTFAICVLHHVDPPERAAFAAEAVRVTRPGGLVAVLEHNPINPLTRRVVLRCEFDEGVELLGIRETRRLLSEAGAGPVESRYVVFFPWHAGLFRQAERALGLVPLGAQYVVAARRT
jgi:SAM-dependent methyltransferase